MATTRALAGLRRPLGEGAVLAVFPDRDRWPADRDPGPVEVDVAPAEAAGLILRMPVMVITDQPLAAQLS